MGWGPRRGGPLPLLVMLTCLLAHRAEADDAGLRAGLAGLYTGLRTGLHTNELHLVSSYCQAPCLDYDVSAELDNDWTFATSPTSLRADNLYTTIDTDLVVVPVDHLKLVGRFSLDQLTDVIPGQDQAFNGEGVYVDQLFADVDAGPLNLYAGKIHPAFGRGWDVTPGIHSTDIPGNYELQERIGFGGGFAFDAFGLDSVLQASAFTTDRTVLNKSFIVNRPRTHLRDGGAGNTEGLSSLAVTLDSCLGASAALCYGDGVFGFQLAGLYQRAGRGDYGDETGFAASVNKSFFFGKKALRLFGEVAYFDNFEGSADSNLFLTASGELEIGPMAYSLAYTVQKDLTAGGTEKLFEVAAAYDLSAKKSFARKKWSLAAAYSFDRNAGEDAHVFALRLTLDFSGSVP